MLVGISGKMGAGKSTVASLLVETGGNVISFADGLRNELKAFFGLSDERLRTAAGKASRVDVGNRNLTVRELAQWWGTEVRRAADQDYWTKIMRRRLDVLFAYRDRFVVIDDVRFPDEAQVVHDYDGLLIRLEAYPGYEPGEHALHSSETALDDYPAFDAVFTPRFGALRETADEILALVESKRAAA